MPRPRSQAVEIGDPEVDPGPGEQPHELVAPGGIGDHMEQGEHISHFRCEEQPTEPDDLVGDPRCIERSDDRQEVRTLAAQHRGRGGGIGGTLREQPLAQRRRDDVGAGQHRVIVAPTRAQRQAVRGCRVCELGDECRERGRTGPSPSVDRLVRITDGGDRHRLTFGHEQRPQQGQLGVRGVLELVEQHDSEAVALPLTDLGVRQGQLGRDPHLVREVQQVPLGLEGSEALDDRHDGSTHPQGGHDVAPGIDALAGLAARDGLDPGDGGVEKGGHLTGSPHMLSELAGQVDHGRGFGAALPRVDDDVDDVVELLLDRPAVGHRILLAGQDQRRGQQRLPELGEQGAHHRVLGDAHPHGALLRVQQPPRHLGRARQDEGVGARRRRLDGPEHRVVDVHELTQLGEVPAHQGEVVLVVQPADREDALLGVLVAHHRPEGVARVGRVRDQAALSQHAYGLRHGARLGVDRMDVEVAGHDDTIGPGRPGCRRAATRATASRTAQLDGLDDPEHGEQDEQHDLDPEHQ